MVSSNNFNQLAELCAQQQLYVNANAKEFNMSRQVITVHYVLTDNDGKTIDSSKEGEPLTFLEGAGQIIIDLEKSLIALRQGDKREIKVPHGEAYGSYDQALIYTVAREKFPQGKIKVGDMFEIGKDDAFRVVTVIEVSDQEVVLDANHPLAGKDLTFNVEILEMRSASPEELAHSHVHGHGGHHH